MYWTSLLLTNFHLVKQVFTTTNPYGQKAFTMTVPCPKMIRIKNSNKGFYYIRFDFQGFWTVTKTTRESMDKSTTGTIDQTLLASFLFLSLVWNLIPRFGSPQKGKRHGVAGTSRSDRVKKKVSVVQ